MSRDGITIVRCPMKPAAQKASSGTPLSAALIEPEQTPLALSSVARRRGRDEIHPAFGQDSLTFPEPIARRPLVGL